jgi:hypothetical protein
VDVGGREAVAVSRIVDETVGKRAVRRRFDLRIRIDDGEFPHHAPLVAVDFGSE